MPSSKSEAAMSSNHIQVTERKSTRKPSYTRRISLNPSPSQGSDGDNIELMPSDSMLEYGPDDRREEVCLS